MTFHRVFIKIQLERKEQPFMTKTKQFGILLGGVIVLFSKANAAELKVGDPAPDFTAASSDGSQVHLQEKIGPSPIVLYFYPKDDTPGCTKEACGLRDHFAAFRKLNALVY